jgi:hypothetical protein
MAGVSADASSLLCALSRSERLRHRLLHLVLLTHAPLRRHMYMLLSVVLLLVFLIIVFIYSIRCFVFSPFCFPLSCLLACLLSIALASAAVAEVLVF